MIKIDEEIRKKYKIQPPPQNIIFEYGKKDIGIHAGKGIYNRKYA